MKHEAKESCKDVFKLVDNSVKEKRVENDVRKLNTEKRRAAKSHV